MQAFVSDYVERAFAASPRGYAWNMSDALTVAPTGFFWQSATKPLDVRIYGEFQLPARWDPATQSAVDMDEKRHAARWSEYWKLYKEGNWQTAVGSRSGVPALAEVHCSQRYPNSSHQHSRPDPRRRIPARIRRVREDRQAAEPHRPDPEQRPHQRHPPRLAHAARHGGR